MTACVCIVCFSKGDIVRVSPVLSVTGLIGPFLQVQSDQCTHLPHCGERLRWRVPLCLFCCQAFAILGSAAQGGQKVRCSDSCPPPPPCIPSLSSAQCVLLASWRFMKVMPTTTCADCLACSVTHSAKGDRRRPPHPTAHLCPAPLYLVAKCICTL